MSMSLVMCILSANLRCVQYLNNKAGYVEGIWKIIHWAEAEKRYTAGVENPLKL